MRLDFEPDRNYDTWTARTDDPRVVAVMIREDDPPAPWGDALAPAYWIDHGREPARAGDVYHDDESDRIARAYREALTHFGNGRHRDRRDRYAMAERYLRIFYDVREVRTVRSTVYRGGDDVAIFDTPGYRRHVGIPDDAADVLVGNAAEWQAYLDGDVYGIGVLVNHEHVLWGEDEGTPNDEGDGWEWAEWPLWGLYGDDYAEREAKDRARSIAEELPELLAFSA